MKAAAARECDIESLQQWLTERLGSADWFGGESFGWADAAVAPMVNRSVYYGLGPDPGSPLKRWHTRLRERSAVAETIAEFDHAGPGWPQWLTSTARVVAAANIATTGWNG